MTPVRLSWGDYGCAAVVECFEQGVHPVIKCYDELTDAEQAAAKRWLFGVTASFMFPLVSSVGLLLFVLLSEHASIVIFMIWVGISFLVRHFGMRFCIKRCERIAGGCLARHST
jgi:hypothetical protein